MSTKPCSDLAEPIRQLHNSLSELTDHLFEVMRTVQQFHRRIDALQGSRDKLLEVRQPQPELTKPPRILRLPEVTARVGLGRSSVWRMVQNSEFPQPIRLSKRAVGWLDQEVDSWLNSRKQ